MSRLDIDKIRKETTRENFLIYGSCPCDYGLEEIHRNKCSSRGVSAVECIECKENAIRDIKFKDDDIELERKLMKETLKEAMNREIKKYEGWKIIKMLDEGKLDDEITIVWHGNKTQERFKVKAGCLYHDTSRLVADMSWFVRLKNSSYFTIEEYMTFIEAKKLGTPKHKDKGYSYQDYKVSEFINEMDKKVWYV